MEEIQIAYLYDGTFHGLLTAVFDAWQPESRFGDIRMLAEGSLNLLEEERFVCTDMEKASRVAAGIQRKVSQEAYESVYRAYLSDLPERGRVIYRYLKLAFRIGREVNTYVIHPDVMAMQKINRMYANETQRMYGFVRFRQVQSDFLYAEITTEYNQLEVLSVFFLDRMPGQKWVLYDSKRKLASLCNGSRWLISDHFLPETVERTQEEMQFERMWKEYLAALTIRERCNYPLQRQKVPIRYRKNMVEWEPLPAETESSAGRLPS